MHRSTIAGPHRRRNILTGEWLLVSPHRTQRPWQGEVTPAKQAQRPAYDPACYLCPGNVRANGEKNPTYQDVFVFDNDFPALLNSPSASASSSHSLLQARPERGICRVVNFSPRHDLTLAQMEVKDIETVVRTWQKEHRMLGAMDHIRSVQIFENKGAMMGNSNPHPHCQIWAQESVPMEPQKECRQFLSYFRKTGKGLLGEYIKEELRQKERIVYENEGFVVLVPFWAVWPYETMIVPRKKRESIAAFTAEEAAGFADAIKRITSSYDRIFETSFPYSSGIHSAPTDGKKHPEWHCHMHFYPPLLRSAEVKKFMVGYEMMAEPQRDITAEQAAERLRNFIHHP